MTSFIKNEAQEDDKTSINKCRLVEIFQTIIINLSKNHYSEINDDEVITFHLKNV